MASLRPLSTYTRKDLEILAKTYKVKNIRQKKKNILYASILYQIRNSGPFKQFEFYVELSNVNQRLMHWYDKQLETNLQFMSELNNIKVLSHHWNLKTNRHYFVIQSNSDFNARIFADMIADQDDDCNYPVEGHCVYGKVFEFRELQ